MLMHANHRPMSKSPLDHPIQCFFHALFPPPSFPSDMQKQGRQDRESGSYTRYRSQKDMRRGVRGLTLA